MLDLDRVWARVSQSPVMQGRKLSDFIFQAVTKTLALAASTALSNQTVNFPGGAVIVGICAAAQPTGQAATQQYRPGLDLFMVAVDYQTGGRAIAGTDQAIASSVFGPYGDQFPGKEILVPSNATLIYSLTNLTSSALTVSFTHHCLVPNAMA